MRRAALLIFVVLLVFSCADEEPVVPAAQAPQSLHPRFELTRTQLDKLLVDQPEQVRARILEQPNLFLELIDQVSNEDPRLLSIVDRDNPLPPEFVPTDLVELDDYSEQLLLNKEGMQIDARTLDALLEMQDAARQQGLRLLVSSAYRSYEYQEGVYQYWVDTLGVEEADRVSARPGSSQHQLGTTIDFGCICDEFADTAEGIWLFDHAWKYGFSLSYPDGYEEETGYAHESWHYRFIGRAAAQMERSFFRGLQYLMLDFLRSDAQSILAHRNAETA